MEPTEEQIKNFWTKLADEVEVFNKGGHYHFRFGYEWYRGESTSFASGIPTIDLNNLFKYAVPKVLHWYIKKVSLNLATVYACVELADGKVGEAYDNDPALALFWAIDKVREGK